MLSLLETSVVLTEGSVVERVRRTPGIELDPFIAHAGLIYSDAGRTLLEELYTGYIDIGRDHNLPFLTLAPTWRANPERIAASGLPGKRETINKDCIEFLREIRDSYGEYKSSIWIGGLMACRGDAYNPWESLTRDESLRFHHQQVEQLADGGVDLIRVATLPAVREALGIAGAIETVNVPYVLSFVVRPDGNILDGTPLAEAVELIDDSVQHRPVCYAVNCVHPTVFDAAMAKTMERSPHAASRIKSYQANTSDKSPEELDGSALLETADPAQIADQVVALRDKYGLKILGGCCGTDERHIREIARRLV